MARMRHFLKRCPAVLLSAALLAAAVGTAAAADTPAPTLGIYTTGDMGGRLYREDPVTGEAVEYSYQNVASAMEAERASVDAALLLDSGDAVDNGLVQDGGAAEALALRAIGYDALVPAVGEFRLGPEARDDFFAALGEASEDGAPVRVLSGNYLDEDTQSPEEDAYEVFTVELGRRAVRIGVLGLGAMEAPEELPESFVSGVRFAHRDNTSGSYSWEWTGYWQERLEKENCDLVVVVCHAGQDELARFAAETTGIDLLVGGHGEAAAETLQNADGEPVSLVSGGGTSLTRTTITLSPKGEALAGMTVEQKAAQLLVAGIEGTEPGEDAVQAIQGYQVGGVILFGRNVESAEQLAALTNGLKELNGDYVPLFLCVDQEGGRVDRMPPEVSRTPSAWSVGQTLDTEGVGAAYGALLAEECAAFGFNMDFAPSLDIWSNPDNTVIGDRAFGNDWEWTAFFGMSAVEGMEKQGTVIPVVKHFPGHGDTAVDSHTALPVVDKTLEDLWQSELVPFDMVLSGQFWGEPVMEPTPAVMVAHILLSQIDPDNPASLSPEVVTGLLREEMGYEGVVCTDDLTMGAISNTYGMGEAAVLAVEAGCDLLLVCHGADNLAEAHAALVEAVDSGCIPEERLDESVYRVLSLKTVYGLSNAPVEAPDIEALNDRIAALERSIEADTSQ